MSKPGSNNEIDSLEAFFSDKLKDASMQPSEKVWQQIEGSLNEGKGRRRRFIWLFFSGLIFISAGVFTYVFMSNKNELLVSKKNDLKNKITIAAADKKISGEENASSTKSADEVITTTEKENVINKNAEKEQKINNVKIQLGAFKKQIDKSVFDKTGLVVKSETNENGVTRYYAEVPENKKQEALRKMQQAGFADAFIKEDNLVVAKTNEVKNEDNIKSSSDNKHNLIAGKNNETKKVVKNTTASENETNVIAPVKNVSAFSATKNTNTTSAKTKDEDLAIADNATVVKNETGKKENEKNTATKNKQTPTNEAIAANTNTVSENNKLPEETKAEPVTLKQNDDVAKTDSPIKIDTATVAVVNKTDSSKTEEEKKGEPLVASPIADSLPPTDKMSRWAFVLTGGANFVLKNAQILNGVYGGPDYSTTETGEKERTTFNTTFKTEFKFSKRMALSVGLNYSSFTAQQDATLFSFNRYQNVDYGFVSTYGVMIVNMNTMLQGYNPAPWITTLKANYSYTSKINTLQVPIEMKWYVLNNKRVNLYTAFGTAAMFVLSEQTKLSIIKEHLTNNLTYNNISVTKYNALLMLGLGGDVRLYKQLYFTVDGGFRYGILDLGGSGVTSNLTYFSVNGGLKIKL